MTIQTTLQFDIRENCDPQYGKNVQNEAKEHANVCQFWNRIYECLENLLESFCFADNF